MNALVTLYFFKTMLHVGMNCILEYSIFVWYCFISKGYPKDKYTRSLITFLSPQSVGAFSVLWNILPIPHLYIIPSFNINLQKISAKQYSLKTKKKECLITQFVGGPLGDLQKHQERTLVIISQIVSLFSLREILWILETFQYFLSNT